MRPSPCRLDLYSPQQQQQHVRPRSRPTFPLLLRLKQTFCLKTVIFLNWEKKPAVGDKSCEVLNCPLLFLNRSYPGRTGARGGRRSDAATRAGLHQPAWPAGAEEGHHSRAAAAGGAAGRQSRPGQPAAEQGETLTLRSLALEQKCSSRFRFRVLYSALFRQSDMKCMVYYHTDIHSLN